MHDRLLPFLAIESQRETTPLETTRATPALTSAPSLGGAKPPNADFARHESQTDSKTVR